MGDTNLETPINPLQFSASPAPDELQKATTDEPFVGWCESYPPAALQTVKFSGRMVHCQVEVANGLRWRFQHAHHGGLDPRLARRRGHAQVLPTLHYLGGSEGRKNAVDRFVLAAAHEGPLSSDVVDERHPHPFRPLDPAPGSAWSRRAGKRRRCR